MITLTTSKPTYRSKVVAEVDFPVLAYLEHETADRRRLRRHKGDIAVRLPAPIMTDYGRGPKRPGVSEIGKYRMIGALLTVTIGEDSMTGTGVLYKTLPEVVHFWPAIDLDRTTVKGYKNGRSDILDWTLVAVTLHDYPPAWPDIPRARITRQMS
jgi:hypothetical protein